MKWIKSVSIGGKLGYGFFIPLCMMIGLGVLFIVLIQKLNDNEHQIVNTDLASLRSISEANTATSDFRVGEIQHILSTDAAEMKIYKAVMDDTEKTINAKIDEYKKLMTSEDHEAFQTYSNNW